MSKPIVPLTYDFSNVFVAEHGLQEAELDGLDQTLDTAFPAFLQDLELYRSGAEVPAEKQPLDAGFFDWPQKLLDEYRADTANSELGRILACARRLADQVDRVVSLGIGGSYMGARALMEACCHPYHNELSRGARAGWPRIYFDGNNVDNDATQGLLDLLGREENAESSLDDRWGIVVISKSGGTMETAVAFRQYLAALRQFCHSDPEKLKSRVVPVTGKSGKLFNLATELGCEEMFHIPDGIGGRFSIFTAVGLLPAALMGLDIVRLLEGAAAMNERFLNNKKLGENPALDYAVISWLMEKNHGNTIRVLSTWGKGLEAAGLWYDQLLSESLGKQEKGATPLTAVNTRDLHSRGQQHQEGRRDKLITNVIVEHCKRDRLAVGRSEYDQDQLNVFADKTMPEILNAAIAGTNQAYRDDNRPTADILLPNLDEASMGQFFQMLMISTVFEGYLIGVNPYGQPGVEGYKKNMQAILRGEG